MLEALLLFMRIFQVLLLITAVFLVFLIACLIYFIVAKPVPWVPTGSSKAKHLLSLADLKEGETVLDLGCGDGRILLTAASEFGAKGIGYDVNPALLLLGQIRKLISGHHGVSLRRGNLFKVKIPQVDVVSLYLFESTNEKLLPRLQETLPQGTRVVTRAFKVPGLSPKQTTSFENEPYYLYEL